MIMDPNQQYPGSSQGNPYEFILNPSQPPKNKKVGLKGNFFLTIGVIVASIIAVMIIAAIMINALAPQKITAADLTGIAQTQNELLRISRQGSSDSTQQVTRNLATTIEYTMLTQQKQTIELLSKKGGSIDNKGLALKQNAATDQKFRTAKSTSTYDKTFTEIIQTELNNYAASLKALTEIESASQSDRARMSDYYRQVQDLLSQVPYTQDSIESGTPTPQPAQ